jgi:putative MATE family efflux protein
MDGKPARLTASEAVPMGRPMPRGELRHAVWSLAWPVILTLVSESMVGVVDVFMVGRLGATAVASVGIGTQLLSGAGVVMTAVGTGTLALIARQVGAGEQHGARLILAQSIVAALALSLVAIAPVIAWAPELVGIFGVEPEVARLASGFVRVVMLAIPAGGIVFVIGSGLRGAGDTRTPLAIGVTVNVLNVAFNYLLIFGKLGFPALGVRGSGLATTIAFSAGAMVGLVLLLRGTLRLTIRVSDLRPRLQEIRRVLKVGVPAAAEQLLIQIGFFVYLLFVARYGTKAVAAYFIGARIMSLSFLPGFGFAAAAGALVGQSLGAGNPRRAESAGWLANRMSVYLMSTTGVVIFVAARRIAELFVGDPEVVTATVSFMYVLGLAQPLMGVDFTLGGALRGAGDTRFPLLTVLVAFYGCRLGASYVVSSVLHLNLTWLWSAVIGDYFARAALKWMRFAGGQWKKVAV